MERAQIRNEQAWKSNARKQGAQFLKIFLVVTFFPEGPRGKHKEDQMLRFVGDANWYPSNQVTS